MSYLETIIKTDTSDFSDKEKEIYLLAFEQGIRVFAHWKDGEQYVGTGGTKLKDVVSEIESIWGNKNEQ